VIRPSNRARGQAGADRDNCAQEFWIVVVARFGQLRYEPARGLDYVAFGSGSLQTIEEPDVA
jgi:hypothetical protein